MPHQVVRVLALCVGIAGCTSTPEFPIPPAPVFPPPPEAARLIYDGTLRSSNDIEEKGFGDRLHQIATGSTSDPTGLGKPYGIAVHKNRIYVSDTQQRAIVLFDLDAKKLRLIGIEGSGTLLKPMGMDISSRDELFVADLTAKRVVVFDLNGNYLRSLGNEDLFRRPSSVTVSPDAQKVYVVDTGGLDSEAHFIYVLNAQSGELLQKIGGRGSLDGQLNIPLQASTSPDGKLHVVDSGNFRVQSFSASGQFLNTFGTLGRKSGQFSRPKGIATDAQGNIYVVDTAFGNFQMFTPDGELLMFVGTRGTGGGPARFMLPAGIDVDDDGRVYVVDQFFRKVDIFRPAELPESTIFPKR